MADQKISAHCKESYDFDSFCQYFEWLYMFFLVADDLANGTMKIG